MERPQYSARFPVFSWAPQASYCLFIVGFLIGNMMTTGKLVPLVTITTVTAIMLINLRSLPEILGKYWIFLLLPIPAIISNLWSPIPLYGLSLSIQLLLTVLYGILMGALLEPRKLVEVLVISLGIYCVMSVASGNTGPSTEGPVLIGFSGAKNTFGLTGQGLGIAALSGLLLKDRPLWFRLACVFFAALGFYLAFTVHATTAVLMALLSVLLLIAVMVMAMFRVQYRFITLVFFAACLLIIMPLLPDVKSMWNDLLAHFGKDPTLTGRTTLWRVAQQWIQESPFIGHGYRAFWMSGSPDSLSLLEDNHLRDTAAKGFHFHNTAVEILVDTGFMGLSVYILVMAYCLFLSVRAIFFQPNAISALFAGMFFTLMFRAFAETLLLPFSPFLISMVAGMVALTIQWKQEREEHPLRTRVDRAHLFRQRRMAEPSQ